MGWRTTADLDQFGAAVAGYLRPRAAENTLLLSAAQAAAQATAPPGRAAAPAGLLFGWWEPPSGGEPRGAFLHDPSAPLLVSGRVPETAAALAATLARLGRLVIGVDAPTAAADAFAAAWSQRAGTAVRVHRHCRVYRLVLPGPGPRPTAGPGAWPPPGGPGLVGRLRVATAADGPLLADWLAAFAAETADRTSSPGDAAADLIGYGGAVFWEVPGRAGAPAPYRPVALATLTRPVAGSVRVSIVYTLPESRHRGYGAAVMLGVSHAALARNGAVSPGDAGLLAGAAGRAAIGEVVVIIDKNRSGHWGSSFGFQLVGERTVLRFGPVTGPVPRLRAAGASPRLPTGPLPRLPRLRPQGGG